MVTANKYDQTKANREGSPDALSLAVTADRAEDWLTAYQIERDRITREREAELEEKEKESKKDALRDLLEDPIDTLREKAKELIEDKLKDKLEDLVPWIKPFSWVIEKAQENQLRVQDAIAPKIKQDDCGVSIDSPFIKLNLIDENCRPPGAKPEIPIPPPTSTTPGAGADPWKGFAAGNAGKGYTLHWNYTGWVSTAIVSNSNNSISTLINEFVTIGNLYNVYTFAAVNPNWTAYPGNISLLAHSGLIQGHAATSPAPSKAYTSNHALENLGFARPVPGWFRSGFYGRLTVLSKSRFNLGTGPVWCLYVSINFRQDIQIGNLSAWTETYPDPFTGYSPIAYPGAIATPNGYVFSGQMQTNYENRDKYIQLFFEGCTIPGTISGFLLGAPEVVNFDRSPRPPRIKPPPPPPKKKCDCMTNCCPQNQYDLAEVKRLLLIISNKQKEQDKKIGLDKLPLEIAGSNTLYKKLGAMAKDNPVSNFLFNNWLTQQILSAVGVFPNIKLNSLLEAITFGGGGGGGTADTTALEKVLGKPKEVALWDTDFTKKGSQVEKKTPKDMFDHLALLTDRVEVALKIIGIHDLPISVDKSRSKYDNIAKLFIASPSSAMVEMGKSLLQVDRKQITSVFQLLNWVGDTVDEKLGHWESEVSFKDVDLLKENDQEMKLVHGNMQHALHDITKFSGNAGIHSEANTWLLSDVLMEMAVLKKEIMGQTYTMQVLVDYLGFAHGEEKVDIPIPVTFDPQLLKDKNLSKFLEDSTTPIQRLVMTSKEKSLSQRLTEMENTLGILRAVNLVPIKGVADIKALLELLNKDKDWEKFIKTMNTFSDANELQLELKTIKKDDPTK